MNWYIKWYASLILKPLIDSISIDFFYFDVKVLFFWLFPLLLCLFVCFFVRTFVTISVFNVRTVMVKKLSEQIRNGSKVTSLNSSRDSTLKWGAGRALLCPTPFLWYSELIVGHFRWPMTHVTRDWINRSTTFSLNWRCLAHHSQRKIPAWTLSV